MSAPRDFLVLGRRLAGGDLDSADSEFISHATRRVAEMRAALVANRAALDDAIDRTAVLEGREQSSAVGADWNQTRLHATGLLAALDGARRAREDRSVPLTAAVAVEQYIEAVAAPAPPPEWLWEVLARFPEVTQGLLQRTLRVTVPASTGSCTCCAATEANSSLQRQSLRERCRSLLGPRASSWRPRRTPRASTSRWM